jgi:elongation factor Ts
MSNKIDMSIISKLREETGAPVIRVKKVLDEVEGDEKKALEILKLEGFAKVEKRAGRDTGQGIIATYSHHTGKVAVLVELLCETDFVAKNDLFTKLASEIALQIASMNPENAEELLKQDFIKDPSKTIDGLIKEVIAKTGENVRLGRFYRLEIGK